MSKNKIDILNGSISKNLLLYTIPIVLTGVLQLLYNAADIIVVGRFAGSDSLAAVGSTSSLSHLMINMFIGLSAGTSVCVSQFIGAKEKESTHQAVHTSMGIALIGGIFLMIIGILFSKTFLSLMETPSNIIDEAALYMQIIFAGMPANLIYNFGAAILRSAGDTKTPLIILSLSGIINVILNVFFVVFFGMKAEGVGLATIISQIISAVMIAAVLMRLKTACRLELKKIRIYRRILVRILRIGIPSGIQSIMFSISNVLIQSSINSFGSDAIAGNSAASNIEGFAYTAMNSMYQSMLTFIGQHMGAGRFERIKKIIVTGCIQVCIIGILSGGILLLFGKPLLSLYARDNVVIEYGYNRMIIILSMYFICGFMECITGALRGMGESVIPMLVSVIGVCAARVVWIYTVFAAVGTLQSLYISYPVTWIITGGVQLIFCVRKYKSTALMKN